MIHSQFGVGIMGTPKSVVVRGEENELATRRPNFSPWRLAGIMAVKKRDRVLVELGYDPPQ